MNILFEVGTCACSVFESDIKMIFVFLSIFLTSTNIVALVENHQTDPNYEIVLLRKQTKRSRPELSFSAFGEDILLNLEPNHNLLAPGFEVIIHENGERKPFIDSGPNCHYVHADGSTHSGAISLCESGQMEGFVLLDNYALEIAPLEVESDFGQVPHIVKRTPIKPHNWTEQLRNLPDDVFKLIISSIEDNKTEKKKSAGSGRPIVEAALFFDEAAYKIFSPFFKDNDKKLKDMILAYVNGVQALYHHPSVGSKIDITLIRLEIFKTQPSDLPHYSGERSNLLDSFCSYNEKHNPGDDKDPKHWDMGLYVSGLDFYAVENGKRSGVTMGLATVGGVCQSKYACVIAEFGVTNMLGKPYPSAGFTSVYILAHEIGHNLGMHHDNYQNNCPKEGFIMSPSRGTNGETVWSYCSAQVLKNLGDWAKCLFDRPKTSSELDHTKFKDSPGRMWGPKKQCEVLLRDADAEFIGADKKEIPEICQSLQCKTPHRAGFYFAGPALEGSSCGVGKRCQGGECVKSTANQISDVTSGGWSPWVTSRCQSACIQHSKGYQEKHRTCDNPYPVNTNEGCIGASYDVNICNDEQICSYERRKSVVEFASQQCQTFSRYIMELDKYGSGLQAPYESGRLWMACAIFCRREDTGSYYTPRIELNDLSINPYFPDGTWCHYDGEFNYYCVQHHCLPENLKLTKDLIHTDDIYSSQNAPAEEKPLEDDFLKYLSIDESGRPLLTTLPEQPEDSPSDDDWATIDYIEIPH